MACCCLAHVVPGTICWFVCGSHSSSLQPQSAQCVHVFSHPPSFLFCSTSYYSIFSLCSTLPSMFFMSAWHMLWGYSCHLALRHGAVKTEASSISHKCIPRCRETQSNNSEVRRSSSHPWITLLEVLAVNQQEFLLVKPWPTWYHAIYLAHLKSL